MNIRNHLFACIFAMFYVGLSAQKLTIIEEIPSNPDNEPRPVFPVPSERQVLWNETEFYAFFHFGMNTFTGNQVGYGNDPATMYAPTQMPNPEQWLQAAKLGGMKGGMAVVKHHDGFCLWPTATTDYNVLNSGNDNGRATNIPRDFANAARKLGMKYGFYVSPWDRNSALWGNGTKDYVYKVLIPQCVELAQYGNEQFEMWFDGHSSGSGYYGGAEDSNREISSSYYDMPNLNWKIHQLQPNCVMWNLGGEARWVGSEDGWAGETCWSFGTLEYGRETAWKWSAAESDLCGTSSGWFWQSDEDVKSLDTLWKAYLETVGRNATLILNFPPDKNGVLPPQYVSRLEELGNRLIERLGTDLALIAKAEVSETRCAGINRNYEASNLIDGDKDTYWAPEDKTIQATITLKWDSPQVIHYVSLQEYIRKGQRVRKFSIETSDDGENYTRQAESCETTTIGYKRIVPMSGNTEVYGDGVKAKYLRINIEDARGCPLLHTVSIY